MRTKAILGLAALAAAAATTAMAQSNVYSLNVVGYVNYTFPAKKLVMVCPPLDAGTNDLNTLIPSAPQSSLVTTWNVGLQDFDATGASYSTKNAKWIPDLVMTPGKGFFVTMQADWTNTFVGNVRQGSITNAITGSAALDMIGSMVPLGGSLTTNILAGYAGSQSDLITTWNVGLQDYDHTGASYSTKNAKWIPDNLGINVGDGFFLTHLGAGFNYIRNFTVQ